MTMLITIYLIGIAIALLMGILHFTRICKTDVNIGDLIFCCLMSVYSWCSVIALIIIFLDHHFSLPKFLNKVIIKSK